jgi:hypothetical protein
VIVPDEIVLQEQDYNLFICLFLLLNF